MVPLRQRVITGVVCASAAVLIAACGGGSDSGTPTQSQSPVSPTAERSSPTPSPTEPGIPPGASPLSGRPGGADKPMLAVKLDNTRAAQPHAGLSAADLVYVQEVEWGLTRLVAVFSSQMPDVVGPIRSARVSDIEILGAFGDIPFAYSGAQSRLLPVLAAAEFVDASANASYVGWFDDPSRSAPTDHMLRLEPVLEKFTGAATARDIGFVFSDQPPVGGEPVEEITAQWGSSSVGFRWDGEAGDYVVVMDGADSRSSEGGVQRAATVVIQSVAQTDSGYGDKFGGVTPAIQTVGSGAALVLRDGRMWEVTWERPSAQSGTTYTLPDGSPMPFAIGQEWIVLLDEERTPILR